MWYKRGPFISPCLFLPGLRAEEEGLIHQKSQTSMTKKPEPRLVALKPLKAFVPTHRTLGPEQGKQLLPPQPRLKTTVLPVPTQE